MLFIYLNLLTYYPADLRENTINNNCDFNIIRFKQNEVMCIDYGLNKNIVIILHYPMNLYIKRVICGK